MKKVASSMHSNVARYRFVVGIGLMLLTGCHSAPITGRKQLLLVPESQEITLGATSFQEVVSKEKLSSNQRYIELVNRVGHRIAAAAQRPDYEWEFRVVASPEKNAFCLPGGKVVVYEGIIPICQNEGGLAVVMSHEVAHALARHGGERMSQSYMVNGFGTLLSYVTQNQEAVRRERLMQAYGVASKYGYILPYSRRHELEADHMGLVLMSRAGYDPAEAPAFWTRFAASHEGQQTPEFLSTHPADEHRARALRELLPDVVKIYADAPQRYGIGETILFGA